VVAQTCTFQSGFASGCPSHPSGSWVSLEDALLVERDEDDQVNLLLTILQNINKNNKTRGINKNNKTRGTD
jgi:hypothetical protein